MEFKKILIEHLIKNEITPTILAQSIGVEKSTMLKWINSYQLPSFSNLMKLAAFVGDEVDLEIIRTVLKSNFKLKQSDTSIEEFSTYTELKKIVEKGLYWGSNRKEISQSELNYLIDLLERSKSIKETTPVSEIKKKNDEYQSELFVLPKPNILIANKWDQLILELGNSKYNLYELGWMDLEDLMGHLLEKFGWSIIPLGRTKDDNIDLIASKIMEPGIDINMMVQCKKYNERQKIGVDIVREVWATKNEYHFNQAMIATTSFFTKGAEIKATKWNLELKDQTQILSWCKVAGKLIT